MKKFLFLFLFCILGNVYSQCFHEQIPLQQILNEATVIVEGEVVDQVGIRVSGIDIIQTRNTINVSRVFKGTLGSTSQVDFLTLGGSIGLEFDLVSSGIEVRKG